MFKSILFALARFLLRGENVEILTRQPKVEAAQPTTRNWTGDAPAVNRAEGPIAELRRRVKTLEVIASDAVKTVDELQKEHGSMIAHHAAMLASMREALAARHADALSKQSNNAMRIRSSGDELTVGYIHVADAVRKLCEHLGVDIVAVAGTAPSVKVVKVVKAVKPKAKAKASRFTKS